MISEACSLDLCETFHDDTLNLLPEGEMISDPLAGDLGSSDRVGPFDSCLHAGVAEYVECMTSSFELCSSCKRDDFNHFSSRVSAEYELSLYEIAVGDGDFRSSMRSFDDCSAYKPGREFCNVAFQNVRAINATCDIILDSGSDATVIPVSMISAGKAGKASEDQSSFLRDAQGGRISTEGVRDISVNLTTTDGKTVTLQDQAHVSSRVDTPLISYGKLLKHGWGIVPEGNGSYLVHVPGAKVPLSFKQNSLLITGVVRVVEHVVRTIDVDIPRPWQTVKKGFGIRQRMVFLFVLHMVGTMSMC